MIQMFHLISQAFTMRDPPALRRPHPPIVTVGHPDERVHGVVDIVDHLPVKFGPGEDVEDGPRVAPPKVSEVVLHIEVDVLGPRTLKNVNVLLDFKALKNSLLNQYLIIVVHVVIGVVCQDVSLVDNPHQVVGIDGPLLGCVLGLEMPIMYTRNFNVQTTLNHLPPSCRCL